MLRARSIEDKDDRRKALLEAALDEFFDRGFSAARMEDIAKRADLSKGTLYLYFESKEDLFKAIIEALATPNLELIRAGAETAPRFNDAMDRLAMFAPTLIRTSNLPKLMKVMIGDSHTFPDILAAYRKTILDQLLDLFASLLARAHEAGEIHVEHPKLAARIVMGPIAISGIWHALFDGTPGSDIDLETLFATHADAMKRAFAIPEAA